MYLLKGETIGVLKMLFRKSTYPLAKSNLSSNKLFLTFYYPVRIATTCKLYMRLYCKNVLHMVVIATLFSRKKTYFKFYFATANLLLVLRCVNFQHCLSNETSQDRSFLFVFFAHFERNVVIYGNVE